jgi:hypothetical protein
LSRGDHAVEGLDVDGVAALDGKMVELVGAVELRRAGGGAEYTPFALMVPVRELPPATPLTLHDTVVSPAPVTVGVKACVLPKSSEAVAGVRVTLIEDGVGVGVGGGGWSGRTGDCAATAYGEPHGEKESKK